MKSTNVLYISCHEVLEYDELSLISTIKGVNVRSCGAYADPRNHPKMRPCISTLEVNDEHIAHSFEFNSKKYKRENDEEYDHVLTDVLLDWTDTVIFMHKPEWIFNSMEALDKHPDVRVVYRSIGQSAPNVEAMLRNYSLHWPNRFTIVRYSPNEQHISGFQRGGKLIRFYKNPEEYSRWKLSPADQRRIIMSTQAAPERGNFVHFEEALAMSDGLPRTYVGPRNEDIRDNYDNCDVVEPEFEELKELYRNASILLYTGTVPACYTLTFVEALMTGMPIVSISGRMWAQEHTWINGDVLEVPELVGAHATVDSIDEGKAILRQYLNDGNWLAYLSENNRQTALTTFNSEPNEANEGIKKQWQELLLS